MSAEGHGMLLYNSLADVLLDVIDQHFFASSLMTISDIIYICLCLSSEAGEVIIHHHCPPARGAAQEGSWALARAMGEELWSLWP